MTAAADALIATDRAGTIVLWNPAAERLLVYRLRMPLGRRWRPSFPLPTASRRRFPPGRRHRPFRHRREPGHHYTDARDRATIEAEMTVGLITDDAGDVAGVIASLRRQDPGSHRLCAPAGTADRKPTSR